MATTYSGTDTPSDTVPVSAGSGGTNWTALILQALGQGYLNRQAATDKQKQAKFDATPKTSYVSKTPYMNEALRQLMPFLLGQMGDVYKQAQGRSGHNVDLPDIKALFSGLPAGYNGTYGGAGGGQGFNSGQSGAPTGTANGVTPGASGIDSSNSSGVSSGDPYEGRTSSKDSMENLINDYRDRGNNLDMLTPDQHRDTAYNITQEDIGKLKKLGINVGSDLFKTIIKGAAAGATGGATLIPGVGGYLDRALGWVGDKIHNFFTGNGASDQDKQNELLKNYSGAMPSRYLQNILMNRDPSFTLQTQSDQTSMDRYKQLNSRDKSDAGPGFVDANMYRGTGSPWDWGDSEGATINRTGPGDGFGGGGGGGDSYGGSNVWDMFSGRSI